MAKYTKNTFLGGKWVNASELVSGSKAKIVTETNPEPSSYTDKEGKPKTQDVCKVQFEGAPEAVKVSLNRATINALVDAYGEDSADWQGKALTVETEKMRVGGKAVVALYLIPDGYEKRDDANGYATIVKEGSEGEDVPVINVNEPELPY
jgi:hypothetical protein